MAGLHINVKEAKAVPMMLRCLAERGLLADCAVDCWVDNNATFHLYGGERSQLSTGQFAAHGGSSSHGMNEAAIETFDLLQRYGLALRMHWCSSAANWKADGVSRESTAHEYTLHGRLWCLVLQRFGFPALDLMSAGHLTHTLPSPPGAPARMLPFISRFYSPDAAGVDLFRQRLQPGTLYYAHPPHPLLPGVVAFLREQRAVCIVVAMAPPEGTRRSAAWWAALQRSGGPGMRLATAGDQSALITVGRDGGWVFMPPLAQELWAFRADFGREEAAATAAPTPAAAEKYC